MTPGTHGAPGDYLAHHNASVKAVTDTGNFMTRQQQRHATTNTILHTIWLMALMTATLTLAACAPVGPAYRQPDIPVAGQWLSHDNIHLAGDKPELAAWWKLLADPVLDKLVEAALRNNNSLEIAGLRILEARAQLGVADGSLYPQSQLIVGEGSFISPPDNTGIANAYWQYSLGASAAWEIDFWGRLRRGIESADAAYLASIEAYNQALVLLVAQVVDSYTAIRVAEEQLRIARKNIALQERSFAITEVLYRNGESSELDVQQATTLLLSTRATIPNFEVQLIQARNSLSTLLGQMPGSLEPLLAGTAGITIIPDSLSVGIPADMLRNRPDVRKSELEAMAQNALVGVAQAGLYPSFSLTGAIGLAAGNPVDSSFGSLFEGDAFTYSVGPSFVWPFLNYGRIKNSIRVQDARLQQALVNYRETALQAAREVENVLAGLSGTRAQTAILAKTVESAGRSAELAMLRYGEGFSDYQRVLDSQQALFAQEQRYVANRGAMVTDMANLFRALGGGWQDRPNDAGISPDSRQAMEQRTDWGKMIPAVRAAEIDNENRRKEISW